MPKNTSEIVMMKARVGTPVVISFLVDLGENVPPLQRRHNIQASGQSSLQLAADAERQIRVIKGGLGIDLDARHIVIPVASSSGGPRY